MVFLKYAQAPEQALDRRGRLSERYVRWNGVFRHGEPKPDRRAGHVHERVLRVDGARHGYGKLFELLYRSSFAARFGSGIVRGSRARVVCALAHCDAVFSVHSVRFCFFSLGRGDRQIFTSRTVVDDRFEELKPDRPRRARLVRFSFT